MARFVLALVVACLISAALGSLPARANEIADAFAQVPRHPPVEAVLDACHDDMIALCGDAAFRMDTLSACLRENEEILSPACSAVQDDFRQRATALREALSPFREAAVQACAADAEALCSPGRSEASMGRATCLRLNAERLSEPCAAAQETLRAAQRIARNLHRAK